MESEKIVGKIAADKNSRRLGRIIKIETIPDEKTKIPKTYALILVKKIFRQDIVILLELEKILKSDVEYVWFDILKEDFEQEVLETRALMDLYKD
ncbi:MAG: hypothetical protein ACFFDW_04820 [Candidatus Thorarchaeota archaeon]